MMLIYTDPHIGLTRKSNFTAASSEARERHVRDCLKSLLLERPKRPSLCLGDFFDKESNSEAVILSGVDLARRTTHIMAGNHDVPNRVGAKSSLQLLNDVLPGHILLEPSAIEIGRTLFCFAPHQLTQTLYDQAIERLSVQARQYAGYRILCLHCSYNSPHELAESSLNLTEAQALSLLADFHYILIGHEHRAVDHFDGRLKIIGSFYPTAFDELESVHRVLQYDEHLGAFDQDIAADVPVWKGTASDYLVYGEGDGDGPLPHYLDLEDDLPPGQTQALAVRLFKEGVFGVRVRSDAQVNVLPSPLTRTQSLPDMIRDSLTNHHPDLVEVWDEFR